MTPSTADWLRHAEQGERRRYQNRNNGDTEDDAVYTTV